MKKGSFTMSQIAIVIVVLVALVILILFLTGYWDKLANMLSGITAQTEESAGAVNIPK